MWTGSRRARRRAQLATSERMARGSQYQAVMKTNNTDMKTINLKELTHVTGGNVVGNAVWRVFPTPIAEFLAPGKTQYKIE